MGGVYDPRYVGVFGLGSDRMDGLVLGESKQGSLGCWIRLDWEVGALLLVEQNHDVWPVRPVHCPTGSRVRECKQQQQAAQETFLQCEIPILLTLSFSKLSPFHICSQLKTSPQAKRHKPSPLFTSLTILTFIPM